MPIFFIDIHIKKTPVLTFQHRGPNKRFPVRDRQNYHVLPPGSFLAEGHGTIRPPPLKTDSDCKTRWLLVFVLHLYDNPVACEPRGTSIGSYRRHVDDHLHNCSERRNVLGPDPEIRPADVMANAHTHMEGSVRVSPQKSHFGRDRELLIHRVLASVDCVIVSYNRMSRAQLVTVSFLLVTFEIWIQHLRCRC